MTERRREYYYHEEYARKSFEMKKINKGKKEEWDELG